MSGDLVGELRARLKIGEASGCAIVARIRPGRRLSMDGHLQGGGPHINFTDDALERVADKGTLVARSWRYG